MFTDYCYCLCASLLPPPPPPSPSALHSYLYLTRTSLDIFNCAPTTPPDGYEYLSVDFVRCWEPGGLHVTLFPFALATFFCWSIAYPVYVFRLLRANKRTIRKDQLLRALGTGDDQITNPDGYMFRKFFSKLYYQFKPSKWCVRHRRSHCAVHPLPALYHQPSSDTLVPRPHPIVRVQAARILTHQHHMQSHSFPPPSLMHSFD